MRIFFSEAYVQAKHGYDTTRKAQWIADSLTSDPISAVEITVPRPVTIPELLTIHSAAYVQAVQTGTPRALAESQRFPWDEGLFHAACASTGGAVAAVEAALTDGAAGSLSSGLHHARHGRGKGNCTFNGLALAALRAKQKGAKEVLIIDADAHFGGGTHSLVRAIPGVTHVDISTNLYDAYLPTGNSSMRLILRAGSYLWTLRALLATLRDSGRFDLCIYNAGMDPHEDCPNGGLRGVTAEMLAERERIVFTWCMRRLIPVAFVMAGGYIGARLSREQLVALHRSTIEAAV